MSIVVPPAHWCAEPAAPPVVVAIAHWNRLEILRDCLESLLRFTSYPHYRICVFDQGSTDGSPAYLRGLLPDVDVVFSDTNVGFVDAMNAITDRYARWDVVLLNNDTRVTEGWLNALVDTASSAPAIGLVGAKLISPDGSLQEAGCDIFADGSARKRGRFESSSDPRYQEHRESDFCSAACLYVKRAVLDRCGALERCYAPGYYEDVDLAFKARAAGFKVIYEPRAAVIHHERASFGTPLARELMLTNRSVFRARWAASLATYPPSPWAVVSDGRPRLLVVSEIVPSNTLWPRSRRIRQLIRELSASHQVVYLNVAVEAADRQRPFFDDFGVVALHPGCAKALDDPHVDLDALLRFNFFTTILCGNPDTACFVTARFGSAVLNGSMLIVDLGMESDVVSAARRCAATHFIVSTDDQQRSLAEAQPNVPCAVLPCSAEATGPALPRHARRDVVFLSDNLDGAAVAEAIACFIRDVVPALREQAPDMRLRLGGSRVAPRILATEHEDLEILPATAPVRLVLDHARVLVVPQHWCGPETISNIEEARARSIPIVTSRAVIDRAGLVGDVDALSADVPDEFIGCILRAIRDPWCWERLATTMKRQAESQQKVPSLAEIFDGWSAEPPAPVSQVL